MKTYYLYVTRIHAVRINNNDGTKKFESTNLDELKSIQATYSWEYYNTRITSKVV